MSDMIPPELVDDENETAAPLATIGKRQPTVSDPVHVVMDDGSCWHGTVIGIFDDKPWQPMVAVTPVPDAKTPTPCAGMPVILGRVKYDREGVKKPRTWHFVADCKDCKKLAGRVADDARVKLA